ncbi:MAG: hypothetical protein NT006_00160 [Candidatus Aminicenantes bacterium]|nr:hypothetical protein [Candidatus Aminicenantes bacterium]
MPTDEGLMRQMDDAASQAQAEIEQNIDNLSARDIITWWSKWYMKTGHKRLGRILVAMGKMKN